MGGDLIIFGLSFLVIGVAFIIISRAREKSHYQDRISDLERYRKQVDEMRLSGQDTSGAPRNRAYRGNQENNGAWSQLINQLNGKSDAEKKKIQEAFEMAGWHTDKALLIYGGAKIGLLLFGALKAWIYVHLMTELSLTLKIAVVLAVALLASYAVDWVLRFAVKKRQVKIEKGFPDALDLMVICSEAGLSLNAIINRVSKDVGQIHPDLGYEMSILAIELNMLSSRKAALENFSNRLQSQLCKNMVGSLLQAEQYGTPISQTMKTLAEEFRFDRLMNAEQRAAKLPVLMAGPLVLFIFPSLFIVILGPAIINIMNQFG